MEPLRVIRSGRDHEPLRAITRAIDAAWSELEPLYAHDESERALARARLVQFLLGFADDER